MRKPKSSNANLYLMTFLGLLFLFAANVDIDGMATAGMDHQLESTEAFVQGSGL
jgi:hypothetical protein